jgi:hypothetical protein
MDLNSLKYFHEEARLRGESLFCKLRSLGHQTLDPRSFLGSAYVVSGTRNQGPGNTTRHLH